jgi:5-methyltetrahydrofolate--homocysteine methyltransferase
MDWKELLSQGLVYLDGGTGTMLQSMGLAPGELPETWNLRHPDRILSLHRAYLQAGCHIISTNTFGANRLKFGDQLPDLVTAAVKLARQAVAECGGDTPRLVALDMGPLGQMLQPLGLLSLDEAVGYFAEVVELGGKAGADLILIETMNDAYETKAAVLAAKEHSKLPVFVTNVYDSQGKLMTGADPCAMIAMLEGLRVDALGMNCSLGPKQMLELLPQFRQYASVPVIVTPNAGLPRLEDGVTVFDVGPEEFAQTAVELVNGGAQILGGCCGTTPEYLAKVIAATSQVHPLPVTAKPHTLVSSYTHAVEFGPVPRLIGERINPTGKKAFQQALRSHDMEYLLKEGIAQADLGVDLLDVNVGLPDIDEVAMLQEAVQELQAVTDLPLQLDTTNPVALEQSLRLYNGKALINSVNGKSESMDAVFPLAAKYGGAIICLTLDENGIPDTVEGRVAIAEKIAARAAAYGIAKKDLIVDPLALTVSAEPGAARVTLESIRAITALGFRTSLGVSNISFGLPARDLINSAFFAMALQSGLSAAIMNPRSQRMMEAYRASLALLNLDADFSAYLAFAPTAQLQQTAAAAPSAAAKSVSDPASLKDAIIHGLRDTAGSLARAALQQTPPLELIDTQIVPALDEVGRGFEAKTVYLPQLLMSADAASAAFDAVKEVLQATASAAPPRGPIVLATVQGDIHDIGKNIVKVLLENYSFQVLDLGRDVPPEVIVDAVQKHQVKLVGLSALMTTTVPAMEKTIRLLRESGCDCRVMVGGAVLTQEYADQIGADFYGKDAMQSVRYAETLFGE